VIRAGEQTVSSANIHRLRIRTMRSSDATIVQQLVNHGTIGAFVGMAVVGMVLWLDVSAIGTMLRASENGLAVQLFLAGAMLKGTLLGLVAGSARLTIRQERASPAGLVPLAAAARA
jgi:hypothetical protein